MGITKNFVVKNGIESISNGSAAAPAITFSSYQHGLYADGVTALGLSAAGKKVVSFVSPNGSTVGTMVQWNAPSAAEHVLHYTTRPDSYVVYSADTGSGVGGQIRAYGSTHATKPSYVEITNGNTVVAYSNGVNFVVSLAVTNASLTGAIYSRLQQIVTTTGTYHTIISVTGDSSGNSITNISAGITNNGYAMAQNVHAIRSLSTDQGTLAELYGQRVDFGHDNDEASSAITNVTYGTRYRPFTGPGTQTEFKSIQIDTPLYNTGTVVNNAAIYIADQKTTAVTNGFAIRIADQSSGGYAIYTNLGKVYFGDTTASSGAGVGGVVLAGGFSTSARNTMTGLNDSALLGLIRTGGSTGKIYLGSTGDRDSSNTYDIFRVYNGAQTKYLSLILRDSGDIEFSGATGTYIFNSAGLVNIANTTAATAYNVAAFTVAGGGGFGGSLYVNGNVVSNGFSAGATLASNTAMELGNITGTATTPYIDFHTSGNNIDYDSRIMASGGSSTVGQGTLTFYAAQYTYSGKIVNALTTTDTTDNQYMVSSALNVNPGTSSVRNYIGGFFRADILAACAQDITGAVAGSLVGSTHVGTGTLSTLDGLRVFSYKNSTGPVTSVRAVWVYSWGNNVATGGISTASGLHIGAPLTTGTITTANGIYIESITGAGNNYAIFTNSGSVRFGGDTRIVINTTNGTLAGAFSIDSLQTVTANGTYYSVQQQIGHATTGMSAISNGVTNSGYVMGQSIYALRSLPTDYGALTTLYGQRIDAGHDTDQPSSSSTISTYGTMYRPFFGPGTITNHTSINIIPPLYNTGTCANNYGLSIEDQKTAAVTNSRAINISNQSSGGYAIYTGTGLVRFGDKVQISVASTVSTAAVDTSVTTTPIADATTYGGYFAAITTGTFTGTGGNVSRGVYAAGTYSGTGKLDHAVGLYATASNTAAGTVAIMAGVYIPTSVNSGGGTVTSNAGLYISDQTVGSTNYAIYTGAGNVRFGDTTAISKTYATTSTDTELLQAFSTVSPATANSAANAAGSFSVSSGGSQNFSNSTYSLCGVNAQAHHYSSGTADTVTGLQARSYVRSGGGSVTCLYGIQVHAYGNLGAGTITLAAGLKIPSVTNSGGGAITTNCGILIDNQNTGASNYAIYTGTGTVRHGDQTQITYTSTATSGSYYGLNSSLTHTPSGASTASVYPIYGILTVTGTQNCSDAQANAATVVHSGSGTITLARGLIASVGNYSTGTITEIQSISVASAINSGGGAVTTNYGIRVLNQTVGTTNYALYTGTGSVRFGDKVILKDLVTLDEITVTTTSISQTTLASISGSIYRSVKFQIQGVDSTGGKYHTTEIIALHNGTTAQSTEYASINIGGVTGTFAVDYNGGNLRLRVTPASTNSTVFKVSMILIAV